MIIDKREKNSLVVAELAERKVDIELRQLMVADYIIGDVAIERKTLADFVNSMLNRRLIRQLEELKQYPKQLLIIEGFEDHDIDNFGNMNPNAIKGMILSIMLDFNVPIVFTRDAEDTASFLLLLEKKQARKPREVSLKPKRKAYSLAEQQRFILEAFPGIGPALSKQLLEKFKTVRKVINAKQKELEKIKKLNKKKAEAMKNIVEGEYPKSPRSS